MVILLMLIQDKLYHIQLYKYHLLIEKPLLVKYTMFSLLITVAILLLLKLHIHWKVIEQLLLTTVTASRFLLLQ